MVLTFSNGNGQPHQSLWNPSHLCVGLHHLERPTLCEANLARLLWWVSDEASSVRSSSPATACPRPITYKVKVRVVEHTCNQWVLSVASQHHKGIFKRCHVVPHETALLVVVP